MTPRKLLIRGAKQLLTLRGSSGPRRGAAMRELAIISDGALLIQNGVIAEVGLTRRLENLNVSRGADVLDATGKVVMPGFVDSHTHLGFGPPRLLDYEMRLAGRSYLEVAAAGGGILSSVKQVRGWTAARLEAEARPFVHLMRRMGTTTFEAKSGYGLDESAEMKQLKVAARLGAIPTCLAAHAVPPEYEGRADAYLDWVIERLLPLVARRAAARFADIYCDRGAFDLDQTRRYLTAARALGFRLKVHASQFVNLGAVALAAELGAVSADHLEAIGGPEIDVLARSPVIATLLPGSVFHLGLTRYAPARALIDSGAAVALATDFNPGSSPTMSMPMALSLACTQMRMTPAEAVSAATINAAHALALGAEAGSLEPGKRADILLLAVSDYRELPYYFGAPLIDTVILNGTPIRGMCSQLQ